MQVLGKQARSTEDATDVTLQRNTTTPLTASWLHIPAENVASTDTGISSVWQVWRVACCNTPMFAT